MQHTTNYNLNQWEAADVVRREDFNADNARLDAALKGLDSAIAAASPQLVKLWEHTVTQRSARINIDVSQMGLGSYQLILLVIRGWIDSLARGVNLLVNGATSGYYPYSGSSSPESLANTSESGVMVIYGSLQDSYTHGVGINLPTLYHGTSCHCRVSIDDITTLNVVKPSTTDDSGALATGSRLTLYGLK